MRSSDAKIAVLVLVGLLSCVAFLGFDEPQKPNDCPDGSCPIEQSWLESIEVKSDAPKGAIYGVAMDLPQAMRTQNWGGGSCVHASTVSLLKWQGQYEMADWWRQQYSGGEYDSRLIARMESAGLRYAYTKSADFEFLRWCVRTRRGAGIFYKPNHAINCVGIDDQYVYLLDNNYVTYPEHYGHYERVPVNQFISNWRGYGGFAWTLVYQPPPRVPHL